MIAVMPRLVSDCHADPDGHLSNQPINLRDVFAGKKSVPSSHYRVSLTGVYVPVRQDLYRYGLSGSQGRTEQGKFMRRIGGEKR